MLQVDHLTVLLRLVLQALGLPVVFFGLGHLLDANGFLLVLALLLVAHHKLVLFLLTLGRNMLLCVVLFCVPLAHVDDLVGFLFRVLNLLPSLQKTSAKE